MRVSPLLAVFLTILFDTLSFSVAIPDLQTRVYDLAPVWMDKWQAGAVSGGTIALYSIAQFVVAPWLGSLSDRVGRRQVLVQTSVVSALSSFFYIFATNLPVICLTRVLGGVAAANVGVAQAYIADNSTEQNRARSMGVLGMAFGTGFIIGPPLGAVLKWAGNGGPVLIGVFSTLFALVNLAFVVWALPETTKPASTSQPRRNRLRLLNDAFRPPALRTLLIAFFLFQLAFTNLESTFFLVGKHVYAVNELLVSTVLIVVGVVQFGVQSGLLRILVPKFGERFLLTAGYALTCPAMWTIPWVPFGPLVYLGAATIGLGSGVATPCLSSLISREAPVEIMGEIFGVTAAMGALARIVGPPLSNVLFRNHFSYPYVLGTALIVLAVIGTTLYRPTPKTLVDPAAVEA